ncbi:MAG: DUF2155 domain-containing protein [Pelagibacterales bacterium]|nr:DUF2155 domain-containing protein [Pelagibacterales bacterium]
MKSGNLATKFNFLFLLVFFLLTLSVNSEEVQISPLLNFDEISPSYEEVFDEDLNIIIDESQIKQESLEIDDVDFVIISILNKITANVLQVKLHLKENYFHDELRIYPIYCKINDPDERPEVSVYLNIYDKKNNDKLFAGWMLKTLPSVSSLEHPLYDIWVNDCT